ncbi:malectin domain-containing carbohydrate-binding protein [Halobacteria archaeon AArc-dxtr1]|nr:malectin domain-containing carbohydrate-binding protein [Halobacteria archaeon AArc-dxtr1]
MDPNNGDGDGGLDSRRRRRFLQGVGVTGIVGVAGCLGDDDENGDENGDDDGDDQPENGDDDPENGNGEDPEPAFFEIVDLEPGDETVNVGADVTITATIENTGEEEVSQSVEIVFDGESEVDQELTLGEGEDDSVSLDVDTDDLEGDYEYEVTTDDDEDSATLTVEIPAEPIATPWALNNGNEDGDYPVVDIDGLMFDDEIPDDVTVLGSPSTAVRDEDDVPAVENTGYDDLYRTEQWGDDIGFEIPVDAGVYNVTLHWAETWHGEDGGSGEGGEGSRVFDVTINGEEVLSEFDPYAEAGGALTAVTRTFTVQATDEWITIETESHEDSTMFNGIEIRPVEAEVPYVQEGVSNEPAFTLLPEGDEFAPEGDGVTREPDELSADVHLGYDEESLNLAVVVTDEVHDASAGGDMWQGDSIQWAIGYDGEYGPEDGLAHVDGEADLYRWQEGQEEQGIDEIEAETDRNDEENQTVYTAAIPWESILPYSPDLTDWESVFPETVGPSDSFRFSVQVNDADGEGREAVLGWTLPGINDDKTYEALGTLTLENPDAATSAPFGVNLGGHPGSPGSELPTVVDDLEFVPGSDPEAIDYVTVTSGEVPEWAEDWFEPPAGVADDSDEFEEIGDTDDDALYQTEFHGPDLGVDIGIENGVYDVVIHNAELFHEEEGERVFDIEVQGETVEEELDLIEEVGLGEAYTTTVEDVVVTDRTLSISSTSHEDFTKFTAIEVREADLETFVDPLEGTDLMAEESGNLGTDVSNSPGFERPDGSYDSSRMNRTDTDPGEMVYDVGSEIRFLSAEYHSLDGDDYDGDLDVYESTDGGDSWEEVDADWTPYGFEAGAWVGELVAAELSEGVDTVRFVISGETEMWNPQLGHVELKYVE